MTTASSLSRLFRYLPTFSVLLSLAVMTACGESPDGRLDPASDAGPELMPDASPELMPDASPELMPDASPEPTRDAAAASDRTVEVVEYGAGNITVVLESGLGSDWTPWDEVAREVAPRARVFAYSRPGYGKSDPSAEPRDAVHIVEELRALLAARGYAPPYLLVGHSFGGVYMELFAKAHPDDVVGVVLVDPRHRDFTAACEQAGLEGCVAPASVVATLPRVQIDEIEAFALSSDEIRAAGPFGPYPVRVLTATSHDGFSPELETLWESMLGSLADEARDGEQSLFVGAGHFLHVERAHDVAEVILSLIPAPEE